MRAVFFAVIAAMLPAAALADTYALTDGQGHRQCIVYDGRSPYTAPPGWTLAASADPNCAAVLATPPNPTVISSAAFQARFTAGEQQAIWAAAAKDATGAIGAGLTTGLTAATVDLTAPALKAWLDALVAVGAITGARETAVMTP